MMGNLTRDPELRVTPNGANVVSFSVALGRSYKNSNGDWVDDVDYINCTAWGPLAERVAQYLFKGSKALVQGRLRSSSWEQDGKKRSKLEVLATDVTFLDAKRDNADANDEPTNGSDDGGKAGKKEEEKSIQDRQKAVGTLDDEPINLDDIPF